MSAPVDMKANVTRVCGFYLTARPGGGVIGMVSDKKDRFLTCAETEQLIAALQVALAAARESNHQEGAA